jgi:hypothetical protein
MSTSRASAVATRRRAAGARVDAEAMAAEAESITGYGFTAFIGCYEEDSFTIGQP